MKIGLYSKLAWSGIRNNRKLYIPYILSCVGMIAMFFIIQSIGYSPLLKQMAGGSELGLILGFGKFVIAAFSLIFLIYTNSFLIRRRFKEFGLYNILGMDKNSISGVVAWETFIVAVISLVGGIGIGIALTKLAELGLLNVIRGDIDYKFRLNAEAIYFSAEMYGAIFVVLLVKSLIQVRRAKPLELLKSENAGEKAPNVNWLLAVLGAVILGIAYYLAVSIESPMSALSVFMVAVIMVIVATYLLFISGSVALCKVLQKNKSYYYKKKHFVSVSSMFYRMKRNGAGLASICILSTMVLVTISSSTSLYFGAEDAIRARYPIQNQISVDIKGLDGMDDTVAKIKGLYAEVFEQYGVEPENEVSYCYGYSSALMHDEKAMLDADPYSASPAEFENLRSVFFIPQDDYNADTGDNISLSNGEALIACRGFEYRYDSIEIGDVKLSIVGKFDAFDTLGEANSVIPSIMLVIPDMNVLQPLDGLKDSNSYNVLSLHYFCGYDIDADDETQENVLNDQVKAVNSLKYIDNDEYGCRYDCLATGRNDFFLTFGGLFFIAIALSILFMFAAAMIIYYKQISEGYEDQSRFEIMQKVGMTKEDIKKSVNSQVLTVFFAPLIMAGVHLAFAFPLIWKMLQLFYLENLSLVIWVTLGAYVVFALIYAIIYKITAGAYYKIVSDNK